MSLQTVRRIAARILNVGQTRIRIQDAKAASEALTADDIRKLIKEKAVVSLPTQGISRGKARFRQARKHAGRGRGKGTKKGARYAGETHKMLWMRKVRSQRRTLRNNKYRLDSSSHREIYRMVSGNAFRGKKQLLEFIQKKGKGKKEAK